MIAWDRQPLRGLTQYWPQISLSRLLHTQTWTDAFSLRKKEKCSNSKFRSEIRRGLAGVILNTSAMWRGTSRKQCQIRGGRSARQRVDLRLRTLTRGVLDISFCPAFNKMGQRAENSVAGARISYRLDSSKRGRDKKNTVLVNVRTRAPLVQTGHRSQTRLAELNQLILITQYLSCFDLPALPPAVWLQ